MPQPETVEEERGGEKEVLVKREKEESGAHDAFRDSFFLVTRFEKSNPYLDARRGKTAAVGAPRTVAASGSRKEGAGSKSWAHGRRGRDHQSDLRRRLRERRRRRALGLVPRNCPGRGPFRSAFPDAEQPVENC